MKSEQSTDAAFGNQLESIHRAVAIILWAVLLHVFTWPFAAAFSGYMDAPLLSYEVMVWAIGLAAIVAFLACRFVFPVTYPDRGSADPES